MIIGAVLPDEEAQFFVAEFADLGNNIRVQWIIDGQTDSDFFESSYLIGAKHSNGFANVTRITAASNTVEIVSTSDLMLHMTDR